MGSLTFSEMATIAIIVLIVFGPRRLPELARRAGVMLSRVREATSEIREELKEEFDGTVGPLEDVRADLRAARDDVTDVARAVGRDLEAAGEDPTVDDDAERPRLLAPTAEDSESVQSLDDVRDQLRAARAELETSTDAGGAGTPEIDGESFEADEP